MTRQRVLIAVASVLGAVVVAVGGLYAYIAFSNRDAPPPAALTPQTAIPSGASGGAVALGSGTAAAGSCDTAAVDGTWTVSPDGTSFAGYRVTEKLASLPARSDAVGRTSAVTGSMSLGGTSVASAKFEADLTKLTSNEQRRDNFIRHDGLESSTFPTATFTLASPLALGGIPAQGSSLSVKAQGSLTLHGVTRTVTMDLQGQRTCAGLEVVGSLPISFADYSMSAPSIGGFVSVDDHGTMEVKLELVRSK